MTKLGMPKWGLSMREGKVVDWLVAEGNEVTEGEELFEVETEKMDGVVESPAAGVLRRRVAEVGTVVPVGGLIGVLADPSVPDADVDAFVAAFQASFVPEEAAGEAETPTQMAEVGGRRLRYLERAPDDPAGDPVVLVHGFGGDLNNWLFNTEKLAERRRVYAHSMGGAIALAYALEQPDRVASLTLIAPAGLGEDTNPDYIDGFVNAERRRELKGVLELLFADQSHLSRTLVDDVLRYKRLDGVDAALRQVSAAMYPSGRQTTVLAGDLDRLTVPRPRRLGRAGPGPPGRPGRAPAGPRPGRGPARHRPLPPTWRPPTRSTASSAPSSTTRRSNPDEHPQRAGRRADPRPRRRRPDRPRRAAAPREVDPDRDADLLRQLDVDPAALVETFSGQSPEVG